MKRVTYTGNNYISNAGANITNITTAGYGTWPLSPYTSYIGIAQGSTSGTRVGNRIKTKRCFLELIMSPNVYDVTNNPTPIPMFVKLWVYRVIGSDPNTAINNWFKQSTASAVGLAGTFADLLLPDNEDQLVILHTEEIKLGYSLYNGTGTSVTNNSRANNDFSASVHFRKDITRMLHSFYDFNDTTQLPVKQPTTWLTLEAIGYNGSVSDVGIRPGLMNICVDYEYTDE